MGRAFVDVSINGNGNGSGMTLKFHFDIRASINENVSNVPAAVFLARPSASGVYFSGLFVCIL